MEKEPLPCEQAKTNPNQPSEQNETQPSLPQNSIISSDIPQFPLCNNGNINSTAANYEKHNTTITSPSSVHNLAPITTFENLKSNDSSTNLVFPTPSHCNFTSEHPMLQFLKMSFVNSGIQQNPASIQYWKEQLSKLSAPINSAPIMNVEPESMNNSPILSTNKVHMVEVKKEHSKHSSSEEKKVISSSNNNGSKADRNNDTNGSKEESTKYDSATADQEGNSKKRRTRKYTKKACLPCRKAHTSCSDERPCVRCKHRGLDCTEADTSTHSDTVLESDKSTPISDSKPTSLIDLSKMLERVGAQPSQNLPALDEKLDNNCSTKPVFNCYKKRLRDQFIASNQETASNSSHMDIPYSFKETKAEMSSFGQRYQTTSEMCQQNSEYTSNSSSHTYHDNADIKEEINQVDKSRGFITFKNFIESEVPVLEKHKSEILMEYEILYPSIRYSSHEFVVQNFEILLRGKNLPKEYLSKILDAYRVSILIDISLLVQQQKGKIV